MKHLDAFRAKSKEGYMKALAIIGLIFASLSIVIPVGGVFIAMLCSIFALISFRSQPTLSGITFGINIINTAFLSPSVMMADVISSSEQATTTQSGDIYWFYVGWHVIALVVAIMWLIIRGKPKQNTVATNEA